MISPMQKSHRPHHAPTVTLVAEHSANDNSKKTGLLTEVVSLLIPPKKYQASLVQGWPDCVINE
jgi:hypothetical protein